MRLGRVTTKPNKFQLLFHFRKIQKKHFWKRIVYKYLQPKPEMESFIYKCLDQAKQLQILYNIVDI